jgi:splicing factor U2AF subunit
MDHLDRHVSVYGSDNDKRTCKFYNKTGTCRYGDACTRSHDKPLSSCTVMIPHMYVPPVKKMSEFSDQNDAIDFEEHFFEDFYEDVLQEAEKIGPVRDFIVLKNSSEHLLGNVFIVFETESSAQICLEQWAGRYYNTVLLKPQLSPPTSFDEARCQLYDQGKCPRLICHFFHIRILPHWLRFRLYNPELFFKKISQETDMSKVFTHKVPSYVASQDNVRLDSELYRDVLNKRRERYNNEHGIPNVAVPKPAVTVPITQLPPALARTVQAKGGAISSGIVTKRAEVVINDNGIGDNTLQSTQPVLTITTNAATRSFVESLLPQSILPPSVPVVPNEEECLNVNNDKVITTSASAANNESKQGHEKVNYDNGFSSEQYLESNEFMGDGTETY